MPANIDDLTTWAKVRLEEVDASVRIMEARLGGVSDEARLQAHLALLDARKWRESFRARLRDLRRTADAGATRARADMDHAWNEFESAFGRWVGATGQHLEELKARTDAQIASWGRIAGDIATEHREQLTRLGAAGATSYGAWTDALRESRIAFEEALERRAKK